MTFSLTQIWFSFYCGYAGTLYYDAFSGSCYNMLFTAYPILLTSVFDRPYSKEIAKLCPELYENGPKNGSFNLKIVKSAQISCFSQHLLDVVFSVWIVRVWRSDTFMFDILSYNIFHGFISWQWWKTYRILGVSNNNVYRTCMCLDSCIDNVTHTHSHSLKNKVCVATCKMCVETRTWTKWTFLMFVVSLLLWFVFALVWSVIPPDWGWGNSDVYRVAQNSFERPTFWFSVIIATAMCIAPEIIVR